MLKRNGQKGVVNPEKEIFRFHVNRKRRKLLGLLSKSRQLVPRSVLLQTIQIYVFFLPTIALERRTNKIANRLRFEEERFHRRLVLELGQPDERSVIVNAE